MGNNFNNLQDFLAYLVIFAASSNYAVAAYMFPNISDLPQIIDSVIPLLSSHDQLELALSKRYFVADQVTPFYSILKDT